MTIMTYSMFSTVHAHQSMHPAKPHLNQPAI